jgi:hypothetical protein
MENLLPRPFVVEFVDNTPQPDVCEGRERGEEQMRQQETKPPYHHIIL